MDDIFSMFGDVFGGHGGFGGFGGGFGGGQRQKPQYRGADLRIKVALTLEEIATGTTKNSKSRKMSHAHIAKARVQRAAAVLKHVRHVMEAASLHVPYAPCWA